MPPNDVPFGRDSGGNEEEEAGDSTDRIWTVSATGSVSPTSTLLRFARRTALRFGEADRREPDMPESGLPIRVYKEHDMCHVDYGDGVIKDHESEEEATAAADAVTQAEERTVVVEE